MPWHITHDPLDTPWEYKNKAGKTVIYIAEYSYLAGNCIIVDHAPADSPKGMLMVGRFSSIGSDSHFMLCADHNMNHVSTYPFDWPEAEGAPPGSGIGKGNIVIGNDCWLGRASSIMAGITVGDGAVVATRAVVTKNVPPYAVVGGNPAKIIRYRFSPEIIDALLRIRWWYWDLKTIRENVKLIRSPDVEGFCRRFDPGVQA